MQFIDLSTTDEYSEKYYGNRLKTLTPQRTFIYLVHDRNRHQFLMGYRKASTASTNDNQPFRTLVRKFYLEKPQFLRFSETGNFNSRIISSCSPFSKRPIYFKGSPRLWHSLFVNTFSENNPNINPNESGRDGLQVNQGFWKCWTKKQQENCT